MSVLPRPRRTMEMRSKKGQQMMILRRNRATRRMPTTAGRNQKRKTTTPSSTRCAHWPVCVCIMPINFSTHSSGGLSSQSHVGGRQAPARYVHLLTHAVVRVCDSMALKSCKIDLHFIRIFFVTSLIRVIDLTDHCICLHHHRPYQILLALVSLYLQLEYAMFAGVAVMILMSPLRYVTVQVILFMRMLIL